MTALIVVSYIGDMSYFVYNSSFNSISTQEAPPLMATLTSGRYHLKCTQLANLPAPIWDAYVAVQDKKIYLAGGGSPDVDAKYQVYVYDVNTDLWGQLPPLGHFLGIPCVIGGRLAIIGGRLNVTSTTTKKVSTFDEASQTWISYYPDLVSDRYRPGVVTHLEYVIVAGGLYNFEADIEILNWIENSHWRIIPINLPEPMWNFTPTVSNDYMVIVGFSEGNFSKHRSTKAYKIPITKIATSESIDQPQTSHDGPTKWITMTSAFNKFTAFIPNSVPPMVVGGTDESGTIPTSDVMMYDDASSSWRKIASLSSARSEVAIATINDNAIIIFGGCTRGGSSIISRAASLSTVELGQVKINKPTLVEF